MWPCEPEEVVVQAVPNRAMNLPAFPEGVPGCGVGADDFTAAAAVPGIGAPSYSVGAAGYCRYVGRTMTSEDLEPIARSVSP